MRNVSAIDFAHLDQEDNFLGTMNPKTTDKKMMSLQFDVMTRDNHDVYLSIINQTKSNRGGDRSPFSLKKGGHFLTKVDLISISFRLWLASQVQLSLPINLEANCQSLSASYPTVSQRKSRQISIPMYVTYSLTIWNHL